MVAGELLLSSPPGVPGSPPFRSALAFARQHSPRSLRVRASLDEAPAGRASADLESALGAADARQEPPHEGEATQPTPNSPPATAGDSPLPRPSEPSPSSPTKGLDETLDLPPLMLRRTFGQLRHFTHRFEVSFYVPPDRMRETESVLHNTYLSWTRTGQSNLLLALLLGRVLLRANQEVGTSPGRRVPFVGILLAALSLLTLAGSFVHYFSQRQNLHRHGTFVTSNTIVAATSFITFGIYVSLLVLSVT